MDLDDDVFNRTSGAIRRKDRQPDFKFYVFDDFRNIEKSYDDRWVKLHCSGHVNFKNPFVTILEQRIIETFEEVMQYEEELIEQGYEGMMARTLYHPYKMGRVTLKMGHIYKRKPLEQSEGIVVGLYEQEENLNEKVTNELGTTSRSGHKENKVKKNTLGGVILDDPKWKEPVRCGTIIGGKKEWRQKMWDNPELIIGATMTYVYQGYGSIDKPRQPRAKAEFRAASDMTLF
jgi:DNA ligase-1